MLAALTRRYGHFADCEDAAAEAVLEAARIPDGDRPDNPRGWLLRVASRRLLDQWRRDAARRTREGRALREMVAAGPVSDADDSLQLLVMCAAPALSRASQVALALRAVAGLTTRQIAAGFGVPEDTMTRRISRAKATLSGAEPALPDPATLAARLPAVRHVIALLFTEGHTRSGGAAVTDEGFSAEAIRLARLLLAAVPSDPENAGLLALLLLTQARTAARLDERGDLVPLAEQDRSRWDRDLIAEGIGLIEQALPTGYVGSFQLQAAIAAVHAEAGDAARTDWPQILALYRMLDAVEPGPAVHIGLATAMAEVDGPASGLAWLERFPDPRNHRYHAVKGHLLLRAGEPAAAREAFARAAALTASIPEQRYLNRLLAGSAPPPPDR